MTTAQYYDLALLIIGALAVAMSALAAWYWTWMRGYRSLFVKALEEQDLCTACRGKLVEASRREEPPA